MYHNLLYGLSVCHKVYSGMPDSCAFTLVGVDQVPQAFASGVFVAEMRCTQALHIQLTGSVTDVFAQNETFLWLPNT